MILTKNGLSYSATSLEDIAAEFDRLAATAAAGGPLGNSGQFDAEANTWRQAAAILRATKLELPNGWVLAYAGCPDAWRVKPEDWPLDPK